MNAKARHHDLSFLPEDYVERRKEQRTNLICLSLFGLVLIGVVGAYLVTTRNRSEIRSLRQQVNAAYAEAGRRIEQLETLQQQKQQMLRKAQVTATLVEKVPRTFLLADLINRMPQSLSLLEAKMSSSLYKAPLISVIDTKKTAMANAKAKKPEDDITPPKYVLTLVLLGVAPTDVQVAQYMASLSRSSLFSDVSLVYSEEMKIDQTSMRKFRMEMTLAEQADVRTVEPVIAERRPSRNPLRRTDAAAAAVPITPQTQAGQGNGGGLWQSIGSLLGKSGPAQPAATGASKINPKEAAKVSHISTPPQEP